MVICNKILLAQHEVERESMRAKPLTKQYYPEGSFAGPHKQHWVQADDLSLNLTQVSRSASDSGWCLNCTDI